MRGPTTFAFLIALISIAPAHAVSGPELELHGYLRAGTGTNGKGAKMECLNNRGAPANEFRLGNECSVYGETALIAKLMKAEGNQPFFHTTTRFAYYPPGNSSFEASPDGRAVNVVEAYVEAGNVGGSPLVYWAGKRFYRDVDLNIFDWYYFAAMSGNGAGVTNIPLGSGQAALAYLVETGATRTNVGLNAVQVLDARWFNLRLSERNSLNLWAAYGLAPGGNTPTKQYVSRHGFAAAARWRRALDGGFNDLTVAYGTRLLESLSLYGNPALELVPSRPTSSRRWRFVEHYSGQLSSRWALHFGAALELWDPKRAGVDSRGTYWAVGARPVYFLTDHWQLAFEAGHSQIRIRNERYGDGRPVPTRELTRLTVAPQLALGPSLWARPVIRAFYARTFWNDANREFIAADSPSWANARSGHNFGVQTEVWF